MSNLIFTLIITAAVLLFVYFGTRFKKKKEAEMNAEFEEMAERGDLIGLSHFYKKQLYWWVPITVLFLCAFGARVIGGRSVNRLIVLFVAFAIPAYRVFQLCKNWFEVEKMKNQAQDQLEAISESEKPEVLLQAISDYLGDECIVTPLEENINADDLTKIYLSAKSECEQSGFYPVILQLSSNLIDNITDTQETESPAEPPLGTVVIEQRMKDVKECFDNETEWNEFLGEEPNTDSDFQDSMDGPDYEWGRFVLVKVPVKRASEIFAKIPMGEWNDCPSAVEHQAVAQYWNEKYCAVPCFISSDVIMYHVPIPVGPQGAYELALEQTAYAPDIVMQGHNQVWALAKYLEQSTFWYFWWD